MDKRQWISAVLVSVVFFALWLFFVNRYEKAHPTPPPSQVTEAPATQPAVAPATEASTNPTTTQAASQPVMSPGAHAVASTQPAENVTLGSQARKDPTYALALDIQAAGAAIAGVTLNDFKASDIDGKPTDKVYQFQQPLPDKDSTAALATRDIVINGATIDLLSVPWKLVSSDSTSALYSVMIEGSDNQPLAEVLKRYTIQPRNAADQSEGFEIAVEQTVRNLRTDKPIDTKSLFNGPSPLISEQDRGGDQMVVVGYREAKDSITEKAWLTTDFSKEKPGRDLSVDEKNPLVWYAQANAYFAAIVFPGEKPGDSGVNLKAEALAPEDQKDRQVVVTMDTPRQSIAVGGSATLRMSVYLGPKWRKILDTPHYAGYPRMYDQMVGARYPSQSTFWLFAMMGNLCQSCQWRWLSNALVWILGIFHFATRDWGLAIILLVVCVRALLHPITKRSQVQMMKMGKLTPEVEKLKKKYADQPDVLNREMMKLYKQQGGAILGCLPMFLQTPIWIALWTALQGTFELRQAPFLFGLTWIHDLARPDDLIRFSHAIPLFIFGFQLKSINLLPILMAVVTYVNQKYFMPMPIAATPEQQQQQKMQRGMSLLFPLMFYTMPSGLNLYYLTSMSLGIVESKIIRDHIKEQEEIAKAEGPEVVVMGKPPRGFRGKGGSGGSGSGGSSVSKDPKGPKPKPGLMERMMLAMQKAQEQAEEMRKAKEKNKKKKS